MKTSLHYVRFTNSIIIVMKNRKRGMKSKGQPQKILSGRRIPLPEEFMEKYKIKEGDIVLLQEEKGKLSVVPANVTPK